MNDTIDSIEKDLHKLENSNNLSKRMKIAKRVKKTLSTAEDDIIKYKGGLEDIRDLKVKIKDEENLTDGEYAKLISSIKSDKDKLESSVKLEEKVDIYERMHKNISRCKVHLSNMKINVKNIN
jgi:exonuclease VII small subunit